MPYYRITITDIHGHISQGVRQDPMTDIDAFYGKARQKAVVALRAAFKHIDVVMLTSDCEDVQKYLEKNRNKTSVVWRPPVMQVSTHRDNGKHDAYAKKDSEG